MAKPSQDEAVAALARTRLKNSLAAQPMPCREATRHSPEISLYLNLHCPRCGQLSLLDSRVWERRCLLQLGEVHRYILDGAHHEFEQ